MNTLSSLLIASKLIAVAVLVLANGFVAAEFGSDRSVLLYVIKPL